MHLIRSQGFHALFFKNAEDRYRAYVLVYDRRLSEGRYAVGDIGTGAPALVLMSVVGPLAPQVAAMELGAVMGRGPLPLECIRVGDTASDSHPNVGASWSSTSSESCCAVRSHRYRRAGPRSTGCRVLGSWVRALCDSQSPQRQAVHGGTDIPLIAAVLAHVACVGYGCTVPRV